MHFPEFFDQVPQITLRDPLAELLGSAQGGLMRYGYADAVRLAGHSCPTVASSYWLGVRSIQALYGDELPERGQMRVELRNPMDEGTTGVVASVLGLLTGAAGTGGFAGLAGQFVRRDLLQFGADLDTEFCITRTDTGQSVYAQAHVRQVPAAPQTLRLMQLCLAHTATPEQRAEFAQAWQDRVRRILLDHAWDDSVFVVRTA